MARKNVWHDRASLRALARTVKKMSEDIARLEVLMKEQGVQKVSVGHQASLNHAIEKHEEYIKKFEMEIQYPKHRANAD